MMAMTELAKKVVKTKLTRHSRSLAQAMRYSKPLRAPKAQEDRSIYNLTITPRALARIRKFNLPSRVTLGPKPVPFALRPLRASDPCRTVLFLTWNPPGYLVLNPYSYRPYSYQYKQNHKLLLLYVLCDTAAPQQLQTVRQKKKKKRRDW